MTTCFPDCGACCDPVWLSYDPAWLDEWTPAKIAAVVAEYDPATDEGWQAWLDGRVPVAMHGMVLNDKWRERIIELCTPGSRRQRNADFISEHWTVLTAPEPDAPVQSWSVVCDAFDAQTRRCTAYEGRPPICSDYPHYGEPINPDRYLPLTCAFNAEVRTVLPIVQIT